MSRSSSSPGIVLTIDNAAITGVIVADILCVILLGIGFNSRGETMFDTLSTGAFSFVSLLASATFGGVVGGILAIVAGWPETADGTVPIPPVHDEWSEPVEDWCDEPDCCLPFHEKGPNNKE